MTDSLLFGRYIGEIAEKCSHIFKNEAVPLWFTRPIPDFDNLTVIEYVWKHGEAGRNRVMQRLEDLTDWSSTA